MVLEDSAGQPVIFDFKFSPSEAKYQDWIKENRSMQLALYKGLVFKAREKHAKAAAYVLLPDVKVITADDLQGAIFKTNVDAYRSGNLLKEMSNSYDFRKQQIMQGIIEDGEGLEYPFIDGKIVSPSIDYADSEEEQAFVPMDKETHSRNKTWNKTPNKYSNYNTFKAGK